jgi:phytoene dehydrogenase-like protein
VVLPNEALAAEMAQIREDLAPSWLKPPLSLAETAQTYLRPALRSVFLALATRPVEEYLARFGFESELLMAMYAVTDGFSGLSGGFGTAGTGMNFLVHNMCRLPGSEGTFMIVAGGMGTVSQEFARLAQEAGAEVLTDAAVAEVLTHSGAVTGVALKDGREFQAKAVLCNCDPFSMRELIGRDRFPADFNAKLDGLKRLGTTLKVNLALDRLPTFRCLPENRGQRNATIHLLPQLPGDHGLIEYLRCQYETVQQGRLAGFPTIEWYIHTQADPSLMDEDGHHNAAFFVQWVPYELEGTTWEAQEERYVRRLFSIAEAFAPGFTESVVDTFTLTPPRSSNTSAYAMAISTM